MAWTPHSPDGSWATRRNGTTRARAMSETRWTLTDIFWLTLSPSTPNRSLKIMNQNQTQSKPADAEQPGGKGLDETHCSRSCIVHGCQNRTDQGTFVGDLCRPCHDYLASGKIGPTTSFLGGMIPAHNYSRQPSACEAVERVPADQLRDAWDWAATYLVDLERRISSENDQAEATASPALRNHDR